MSLVPHLHPARVTTQHKSPSQAHCISQKQRLFFITAVILITALCLTSVGFAATPITFNVVGVQDEVKTNIISRLESAVRHIGEKPSDLRIQQFSVDIPENVKQAMQPFGYFKPIIHVRQANSRRFLITIKPGTVMRITRLDFQITGPGRNDPKFIELKKSFPLATGQVFSVKQYEEAKKSLFHTAETIGYLRAKLTKSDIAIDISRYQAHITLHFATGRRYYFGAIHFSQVPLSPDFLHRYTNFLRGKPFSTDDLLKLQDNLNNSNYFSKVEVKPELDHIRGQQVPVHVGLAMRDSRQYTFGIGYGTDTSVRGTVGVQVLRLNKMGHHFQGYVQASPVQSNVRAIYIIPGRNPVTDSYQISGNVFRQNLDDVDSNAMQFGLAYVSKWNDWQRTLGLSSLIERELNNSNDLPDKTTNWLYPSLTLKHIKADDTLNTQHGYSFSVNVLGASKHIASDASLGQFRVDLKYIHTFNYRTRILARATAGYTIINDINNLAPSLRFYTGGSQSVRGYRYRSLGPGKYLRVGSIELQYLIKDKWSIAGFFDAGESSDHLTSPLQRSVGFGLVRSSPVGSINIGIAKPLNPGRKGIQFIFSMGPDLV